MQEKAKRYDMLKIIAAMLVVISHATRMYTGEGVVLPTNASQGLAYICDFIYAFSMPIFMCCSGLVYGMCIDDLNKYKDGKRFILNKAQRLLIPYYFFGLFIVAPVMVALGFTEQSYVEYCLDGICLVNNSRHLWYIFVLFFIFLLCTVVRKFLDKWNMFLVLGILLVISYAHRYVPNTFQISLLMYHLLYFFVGYYTNRYYEKVCRICKNPIVLLGATAIIGGLCQFTGWKFDIVMAGAGMMLMIGVVQYIPLSICESKLYDSLRKNTFGVYLFHAMIIYLLFYYFGEMNIAPVVLCGAAVIISYAASHLLTVFLRRIGMGILVGEGKKKTK